MDGSVRIKSFSTILCAQLALGLLCVISIFASMRALIYGAIALALLFRKFLPQESQSLRTW